MHLRPVLETDENLQHPEKTDGNLQEKLAGWPPVLDHCCHLGASFTIVVDGKRALSGAEKGKKKGRWARQAPYPSEVFTSESSAVVSS
jgi:hypothetical protein